MSTYEKFKSIIDEIDVLIGKGVSSSSPDFQAWRAKAECFLIKEYGMDSYEYQEFKKHKFTLTMYALGTPNYEFVKACKRDLERVKAVFLTYLTEIGEMEETEVVSSKQTHENYTSVFIVHGHDEGIKQAVARLIEKQHINAIILHEQPNQGATIIEKFERNSDTGAAICLFTKDDVGKSKNELADKPRARQNVVFEAGYFMGKLGRSHVIILADSGVELPSDMQGIVYTSSKTWEFEVLKELKAMGYKIDLNEAF